ncbi:ATP-grasp fold amidoligase family protein [Winogradskyella vincentii]|uniref:Glycosyl transferase n=1 Tax=Winogradskyella vincentii TaxID=2877122 RepID=A0ABS7Y2E5_9FLAO|nr:ATP-grasp fold amidoligase family protein [Winogradskyella vincentii]MCA0152997.1 glycosyl transferase [Winogradskyella vincentii]
MSNLTKRTLRGRISDLYRKTTIGYYLLHPFYKIYEFGIRLMSDKFFVKWYFKRYMGYSIDLDNPQTLNEKITWLKLYDRSDLHTLVADKYTVRSHIKEKIGEEYLIPLLYQTRDASQLKPENLPDKSFIIKNNHDSGGYMIVKDKSTVDWPKVQKQFKRYLKENFYYSTREWQYKNIVPRVVVEELLTTENGEIPNDYKCHCFNGKLVFVHVDIDRFGDRRRNLYDTNWDLIPCVWQYENGEIEKKPELFEKMKKLAETLAKDFIYARIDFYIVKGRIYFGEISFHHHSGTQKFKTPKCDLKFGQLLKLPNLL